jgi:guanylate kinase
MTPPPILTAEQRADARTRAVLARKSRAVLRQRLRSGELSLSDVIILATTDVSVSKMLVSMALESLPGIGKARTRHLMDKCDVSPTRRIRGLGRLQVEALLRELGQ